jgi:hypothetical protein
MPWMRCPTAGYSVRPLLLVFLVASLASAVVAWELLFPVPVAFLLAVSAGLAWSYFLARPKTAAE